ncbi:MAG: type II secretion system F family protein [Limnohabitans sp.]|nr:type II secretion system F family protein [Limnohabitans sp.]
MRLYWYQAMTAEGASVRGSGEHIDLNDLVSALSAQGLQPYRVWSLPTWLNGLILRPLKPAAVTEFCHLMASHVRAGADLRLALAEASASASTTRLRMLCARLKRSVERGDTLSQALDQTKVFPPMLSQLVVVGQETGRLGTILAMAAAQFEQMRQLRNALLRALIYPALVLAVLVVSGLYWLLMVLPKMAALFESLRVQLPPTTVWVMKVAEGMKANVASLPLVLGGVLLLLVLLIRLPAMKPVFHALYWWLPGVRELERARVYHAFFSHLSAMHGAGLTLSRTLTVLMQQPLNQFFGGRIGRIGAQAARGQSLAEGLGSTRVFERFALSLVRLGENTGTLDEQSMRLSEHYAQKLKQQIETGTRLFEPVLLLVLAAVLLLVGSTMLGPVYDLASRASAGIQP